jgi:hypothetical protein
MPLILWQTDNRKTKMQLSDFFIIREAFYNHVRQKLKGVPFDQKLSKFKAAHPHAFFADFKHSNLLNDIGKEELLISTRLELKRIESNISKQIKDCQEQIDLTPHSAEANNKKVEYVKKMQKRIEYLSSSYTPKIPLRDQHTFRASSFVDKKFVGLKADVETGVDVDVSFIGDAVLVRLKEVQLHDKPKFDAKDQVIYSSL